MHDQNSRRQIPVGVVAGVSALILASGGAVAWWSWNSSQSQKPVAPHSVQTETQQNPGSVPLVVPSPQATAQAPQPPAKPEAVERTLSLYWVSGSGEPVRLESTATQIIASGSSTSAVLQGAMETLLAGPPQAATSAIPANTKLRSLTVKNDGIHVDLSKEFTTGGGSTSMTARLGQVIYTATALDPQVPVWLSIDGKPLETLGGEGLMVDQPITRSQYEKNFPLQ